MSNLFQRRVRKVLIITTIKVKHILNRRKMSTPLVAKFARIAVTIVFALVATLSNFAQSNQEQIFKGQVIDQKSRLPISYANIYNQTSENGTISDVEGRFEIAIKQVPTSLEISFIGYETKRIPVKEIEEKKMIITLAKSSIALPEITVSATPKIEAISEGKYSIRDYLPFNDKLLILKNYDSFNKNILSLTDAEGKEISQLSLKDIDGVEGLYQGCLGGLYVLTSSDAHEISFNSNGELQLSRTIDKEKVNNLLLPCIEASPTHVYFQDYLHEGQMVILSAAKRNERGNFVIRRIADPQNIKLLYTQVKARSGDVNDATIQDKDVLKYLRGLQHQYANTMHLFYQPLYIPIVDTGNKLCVFNHFEKQAEFYNYKGTLQYSLPLSYIEEKGWNKPILNDKVSGSTYVVFDNSKGKILKRFNYENASLTSGIPIKSQFVENMKLHNNVLYYLEREGTSTSRVLKKVVLKS